ncbi:redox-sensing transcriptional repressor Rex [Caviibacter abscessus]|uniref:redox-sensing transcriptional repressor Rex n=1 Tax=Caviibacter abscessus TaxID=1766719 RepID=UPI000A7D3EC0|nr:redox-sensing transcriptional repressor Rex [Caviibacter abscessus]
MIENSGINEQYMLNDISNMMIARLTQYLSILQEVQKQKENINSGELATKMKSTSAQVRKDLSTFGEFGVRGKGYSVKKLIQIIEHILGVDSENNVILIGHGKMGAMISNNMAVLGKGFKIIGVFDKDLSKVGKKINSLGLTVNNVDMLESFIHENKVDEVILAVTREYAQEMADELIRLGIKAILNLTAYKLDVPSNVVVINVDISAKLQELNFWKNHISIWSDEEKND